MTLTGSDYTIECDCASTPPTMPVYRTWHLPSCPCSPYFLSKEPLRLEGEAAERAAEIINRRKGTE